MGGLALLLIAAFHHLAKKETRSFGLKSILFFSLIFRAICLPSDLIFEDDITRYLWDGYMVSHGLNPFIFSPEEVEEYEPAATGWLADVGDKSITPYKQLYIKSQDMGFPFEKINYPHIPTIYPPLTQAVFALSSILAPLNQIWLKCILILFDLGSIIVIILLLHHLDIPKNYIILYGWHPLIIKEFANSGHHDSIGIFFFSLMLLALFRENFIWSAFWFGLTVLVKLLPVVMIPILFKKFRWKGLAVFSMVLIAGYLPLITARGENFQGLMIYLQFWTFNSLPFTFIQRIGEEITGNLDFARSLARIISNGLIVLVLGYYGIRTLMKPRVSIDLLVLHLTNLFLLVFLFLPVCDPWYICWLIPLGLLAGRTPVMVLSITVFLSYLYYDLGNFPSILLLLEFGLVYLVWFRYDFKLLKIRPNSPKPSQFSQIPPSS